MLDPTLPPDLAAEIQAIKSAIEQLQMSARVNRSTILEGALIVRNADDDAVVTLGKIGDAYGLRILSPSGQTVFQALDEGGLLPELDIPLYMAGNALSPSSSWTGQAAHAAHTDQGSLTTMWAGQFTAVGPDLEGSLYTWLLGSHSMAWEVSVYEVAAGSGYRQAVATGSSSVTGQVDWSGTIPSSAMLSGTDPRGKRFWLTIRARRTAGADRVGIGLVQSPLNS